MSLFGKSKNYIGVDLGTSALKMVELQNKNGRALLTTYGYIEQSTDIVRSSSSEMEQKIISMVKAIHKQSRMTSNRVIAALPSFSVFSSIINLPRMNKKDMAQAIRWEAKKFIPLPIEEMTLDWKIINEKKSVKTSRPSASSLKKINIPPTDNQFDSEQSEEEPSTIEEKEKAKKAKKSLSDIFSGSNKGKSKAKGKVETQDTKNTKILLTAAPKNLVERYINIFKAANLELLSLETEAFALERSLTGGDPTPVMIIDIGAVSSDIAIIDNSIPILTRSIDVGGSTITNAVMKSLNVDLARAEQFKRDIGFSASGPGELPEIIKSAITPIINEVKYSLDIYLSQNETGQGQGLEKIILTGGSAYLPDLVNYLSKILDIKIIIGDPWDRIVYPLELKPVLAEIGPRFSVAVGLAMREI